MAIHHEKETCTFNYTARCHSSEAIVYSVNKKALGALPLSVQEEIRILNAAKLKQRQQQISGFEKIVRVNQLRQRKDTLDLKTTNKAGESTEINLNIQDDLKKISSLVGKMELMVRTRQEKWGNQKDPLGEFFAYKTRNQSQKASKSFDGTNRTSFKTKIENLKTILNTSKKREDISKRSNFSFFIKRLKLPKFEPSETAL